MAALAFVVESIDSIDRSALVIASQKEEILWIFNLVCEEQTHGLQRLLSSVDVVA